MASELGERNFSYFYLTFNDFIVKKESINLFTHNNPR